MILQNLSSSIWYESSQDRSNTTRPSRPYQWQQMQQGLGIQSSDRIRTTNNSSQVSRALGLLLSISLDRRSRSYIYIHDQWLVRIAIEYSVIAVLTAIQVVSGHLRSNAFRLQLSLQITLHYSKYHTLPKSYPKNRMTQVVYKHHLTVYHLSILLVTRLPGKQVL